jgi:glycosyltransferase involved in cell wall biosynthesis
MYAGVSWPSPASNDATTAALPADERLRPAMTPAVTVVIPTWNRCAMAAEAVESVLAQTWRDFELIVVDDGSNDSTAEHLSRMLHERREPGDVAVRIERIENRRGPAAARNRGVALARAPMVAFLDSDDLWLPRKLELHLAYARAHPEFPISQTGELWVRSGRRVNPARRHLKRAGDIFLESLRTCLISPSAVMLPVKLFAATGGFDEDIAAAEDYDLWLRILARHRAGLLGEAMVIRRAGHPGQLSATVPALDRFRILALAKLLLASPLDAERRAAAASVFAEKCRIYAGGLARRGKVEQAEFHEYLAERAEHGWFEGADASLAEAVESIRSRVRPRDRRESAERTCADDTA